MVTLGKNEYLNQTWPIKDAGILRRPEIKSVLEQRKLTAEADWVMNRYVRAVDESKKHEIILFYLEAGSLIPVPVADLAPGGRSTDAWPKIEREIIERSLRSFSIIEES